MLDKLLSRRFYSLKELSGKGHLSYCNCVGNEVFNNVFCLLVGCRSILWSTYIQHSIGYCCLCYMCDICNSHRYCQTVCKSLYCIPSTHYIITLLTAGYFIRNLPSWLAWVPYTSYGYYAYQIIMEIDIMNTNIR